MSKLSKNNHGEPSNCYGFRDIIDGMTGRAKEEILETLVKEIESKNEKLWNEGRKPLTLAEVILYAWKKGNLTGYSKGRKMAQLEAVIRRYHNISDEETLPKGKELKRLIEDIPSDLLDIS